jgi:hypothetical protein
MSANVHRLAYRNEKLAAELEDAHHRIAETSLHRNKLQEALVVALSCADPGRTKPVMARIYISDNEIDTKRQTAVFLQGELEESINEESLKRRVVLPRSASCSVIDRRYKQQRKRPQSTLINYRFPS